MSLTFSLNKFELVSFAKMIEGLHCFIDHASLEIQPDRLTLGNFNSTHTIIAIASIQRDFFHQYQINETLDADLGIDLDVLAKAMKNANKIQSSDFYLTNETLKIALNGANARQKSYFQLDLTMSNDNTPNLYQSYCDNLEDYHCHLKIETTNFREILASLKVCQTPEITLEYQTGLLIFQGDTTRIEYQVNNINQLVQTNDSDYPATAEEKISLQLGTDQLLSLHKATQLSNVVDIWMKSKHHPIYFSFTINAPETNELVIGLSPRD